MPPVRSMDVRIANTQVSGGATVLPEARVAVDRFGMCPDVPVALTAPKGLCTRWVLIEVGGSATLVTFNPLPPDSLVPLRESGVPHGVSLPNSFIDGDASSHKRSCTSSLMIRDIL